MAKLYRRRIRFSWKMPLLMLCLIVGLMAGLPLIAGAPETPATDKSADFKTVDSEEVLPEIEAKTYGVEVLKHSKSLRVYLLQQLKAAGGHDQGLPLVGKILLFSNQNEPVMAFRVLKTYPDRGQFAASKVKTYGNFTNLEITDQLEAAEKIADIIVPEYTLQDQELDKTDLKELEDNMGPVAVPKFDPALDSGTSPTPDDNPSQLKKHKHKKSDDDDDDEDSDIEDEEVEAVTPDDIHPFDTDSSWLSVEIAELANTQLNGAPVYYTGAGIMYGITLDKKIFARSSSAQDSLVLEGGLFYYKVAAYETNIDSYTIVPLLLDLRYDLMFSEGFGAYIYGGVIKNEIMGSSNGTPEGTAALSSAGLGFGAGLLFRLGPKWFVRTELGIDRIGLGLILRF